MKKYLYTLACSIALLSATQLKAEFYVGAGYGISFNGGSALSSGQKNSYKQGSVYGLQGGYVLPLPLLDVRGELEYLRARPGVKHQHARRLDALMANVTGVIPFVPFVDPYIGLGWGYARYDHNYTTAWQYLMGVEYNFVTVPFTVGLEYKYLKMTESCGKRNDISKYHGNVGMLKLKYSF